MFKSRLHQVRNKLTHFRTVPQHDVDCDDDVNNISCSVTVEGHDSIITPHDIAFVDTSRLRHDVATSFCDVAQIVLSETRGNSHFASNFHPPPSPRIISNSSRNLMIDVDQVIETTSSSLNGEESKRRSSDDDSPTIKLIEVIESLKKAVTENTNYMQLKQKRKALTKSSSTEAGGSRGANNFFSKTIGVTQSLNDDNFKVRTGKVIVELRVVFLKIGEIDTLKEQYSAETFVQAKWREPALDGKLSEELKRIDLEKFWSPLLYIENILSETKEATWLTATLNHRGEVFILERRRVRGIFMENLELENFPLDVQDLTVTITSERPDTEVDIIPDDDEMSGINVQTFVDQQEWKLHEHIEVSRKVMTQEYSSSSRSHPALSVTCRASRRPGYFYWNVFLVMFFISALSFATFSVSPELPQSRLQLSFTLLLTSIAFKFVINQSLPKISYLTYMDKYVLMSLVILCVVCIWHSVVTLFICYGKTFFQALEKDVFIAFVLLYVLCHLVFLFWLYFDACKRRRLMKRKDREYLEFLGKKKEWLEKSKAINMTLRRPSNKIEHNVQSLHAV